MNIREYADKTFDALLPVWLDGLRSNGWLYNDFWKAGNTLDSAINYFAVTGRTDAKESVANLIEGSHDSIFAERPPDSGPWRDDYGWWGNAFANALRYARDLGLSDDLQDKCLVAARLCWKTLSDNAEDNQREGENRPPVERIIGASYTPWNGGSASEYFANDEPRFTYRPVPNTVTSSNFLSLSLALLEYDAAAAGKYSSAIQRCVVDWMYLLGFSYSPQTRLDNPCNMLFNDYLLVRETPNPWAHLNWNYDLDRAWTADQGVCLYALSRTLDLFENDQTTYASADSIRHTLLEGYTIHTSGGHSRSINRLIVDYTLREFETRTIPDYEDSNLSNFNNNYVTGPGVFMRYLGYALTRPKNDLPSALRRVISDSIAEAWANRDPKTNLIAWWYGTIEKSPYYQYYLHDKNHKTDDPDNNLWKLAPQVAALDLFVAGLRTAVVTK